MAVADASPDSGLSPRGSSKAESHRNQWVKRDVNQMKESRNLAWIADDRLWLRLLLCGDGIATPSAGSVFAL